MALGRIRLFADNTLSIPLDAIVTGLNKISKSLHFAKGRERFYIRTAFVSHPSTYKELPQRLLDETASSEIAILATTVSYDNNFFFEAHRSTVIVSFSGWNQLTDLPITNGLVYFLTSLIIEHLGIGRSHDHNVGCINDYWWDKRGVNAGMRAGFICPDCLSPVEGDVPELSDVNSILDSLSRASGMGRDVVDLLYASSPHAQCMFDVFMCHNAQDKPAIKELNQYLQQKGLTTWLDEEQLPLGLPWQPEIEKCIGEVRTAAVVVGGSGFGPWQNVEIRALLAEFVGRGVPVIPIILPSASAVPDLPIFLRGMTWLDLRKGSDRGLIRLVDAIRTHRGV